MSGMDGWFWASVAVIVVAVVFDIVRIRRGRKKLGRILHFQQLLEV